MYRLLIIAGIILQGCFSGTDYSGDGTNPGLEVTTDNHTGFLIKSGSPHDELSCNNCHGAYDSFRTLACTDCHTHAQAAVDPAHADVGGYAYESEKCYNCHPSGLRDDVSREAHDAIFPISTTVGAVHSSFSCDSCHMDAGDRTQIDCITCHTSSSTTPKHSEVGGYNWASGDCLDCHANSQVDRISDHLPFLVKSSPSNKHYKKACRTCHNDDLKSKPFKATDFVVYSCAPCHSPADRSHFDRPSTTCTKSGCHPDGRVHDD